MDNQSKRWGRCLAVGAAALVTVFTCAVAIAGTDESGQESTGLLAQHEQLGITLVFEGEEESGVTMEKCLSCHGAQWEDIVASGDEVTGTVTSYNATGIYNPHRNHRSNEQCVSCHTLDDEQVNTCTKCHEIILPDGWTGYYDIR